MKVIKVLKNVYNTRRIMSNDKNVIINFFLGSLWLPHVAVKM